MPRFPWKSVLLVLVAGAAVGLPILFRAWKTAVDNSRQRIIGSADPFRIAGNLYYVGTSAASVLLITGPEGHVLLDSGYPPATLAAIRQIGFDIKDVKALITSDEHDAARGVADLQHASGAQLWASEAGARIITDGGLDPVFRFPMSTLNQIGAMRYAPARVDHRIKDGETIRVGPIAVTAHLTPGSTRGCTSWSFPVREGGRVLNVVSACPLGRSRGSRYPEQDADLERSFQLLRTLPVDIWVTQRSRDWSRYRKFDESRTAKDPVKPFIDPGGYRAYIDAAEGALRNGVFE